MTLAARIIAKATEGGVTIALAESCTGGMIGALLTSVPGSSEVFDSGIISYSNAAKMRLLGVRQEVLQAYGAVSEQTAQEMATGALRQASAGLAVSTTGIAGPGGSDHKPEGRVCFAICTPDWLRSETVEFGALGREIVRAKAANHALELIFEALAQP